MHCHQKSIIKDKCDRAVFKRLGLDWKVLDSGCCGMAGSFGFEAEKFPLSQAIGEQRLLPAVREMDENTILISDGFSCREQVRDLANIQPKHLCELIASALR